MDDYVSDGTTVPLPMMRAFVEKHIEEVKKTNGSYPCESAAWTMQDVVRELSDSDKRMVYWYLFREIQLLHDKSQPPF